MRNPFLYCECGNVAFLCDHRRVIRTRSLFREALTLTVAVLATVLLLAWGHQRDEVARDRQAFDAGLVIGQTEMAQSVGDAYRQGRADAVAELGVVLGQGCMVPQQEAEQPQPAGKAAPLQLRWSRP